MKTAFLEALRKTAAISSMENPNPGYFDYHETLPGILGMGLKVLENGPEQRKKFIFHQPFPAAVLESLLDWSEADGAEVSPSDPSREVANGVLGDGRKVLALFSPLNHGPISYGTIIFVLRPLPAKEFFEWGIFCDFSAALISNKIIQTTFQKVPTGLFLSSSWLGFLNKIYQVDSLPDSRQGDSGPSVPPHEVWAGEDFLYLHRFLSCIQREFDLEAVFAIQRVFSDFPDLVHVVISGPWRTIEEVDPRLMDYIQDSIEHEKFGTLASARIKILPTPPIGQVSNLPIFSQSFACNAGGKCYGHFGLATYKRADLRQVYNLMTILSNHLGRRFAHLWHLRQEEIRKSTLSKINSVCNIISSNVEIDKIVGMIITELKALFKQESGVIILEPPGENEFIRHPFGTIPPAFDLDQNLEFSMTVGDYIRSGYGYLEKSGTSSHPVRYIHSFIHAPAEINPEKGLSRHSLGGLILFNCPENRPLSEDMIEFMKNFLSGVGASLKVAFNYQEKLDTIRALEGLMGKLTNTDDLLSEMISIIRKLLKVDRCSFLTLAEDGTYLTIQKEYGLPAEVVKNTRVLIGHEISGYVARTGKSLRLSNIEDDGRFQMRSMESYFNRSLLSVPLLINDAAGEKRVAGVINVNNKINGLTFSDQDQKLLEAIAELVVVALENSKLLKAQNERDIAEARQETEMQAAMQVQTGLLPKNFAGLPSSMSLFGQSNPARSVGGDFYECLPLKNGSWMIGIGDVSGKGMSAALLMTSAHTILRAVAMNSLDPAEILMGANQILSKDLEVITVETGDFYFVTLLLVVFEPKTGRAVMSSAGHGPLFAMIKGNLTHFESKNGAPLGVHPPGDLYENVEFFMHDGDSLLLFTDGLHEERSPKGEMMGLKRVEELFNNYCGKTPCDMVAEILREADIWRGPSEAHDDLTVMAMKYKGNV